MYIIELSADEFQPYALTEVDDDGNEEGFFGNYCTVDDAIEAARKYLQVSTWKEARKPWQPDALFESTQ